MGTTMFRVQSKKKGPTYHKVPQINSVKEISQMVTTPRSN